MSLFKRCILLVSVAALILQCKLAVEKLINPPTVKTSDFVQINEIETPLLTICKTKQKTFNFKQSKSLEGHLKGIIGNGTISWGGEANKTLAQKVYDMNIGKWSPISDLMPKVSYPKAKQSH